MTQALRQLVGRCKTKQLLAKLQLQNSTGNIVHLICSYVDIDIITQSSCTSQKLGRRQKLFRITTTNTLTPHCWLFKNNHKQINKKDAHVSVCFGPVEEPVPYQYSYIFSINQAFIAAPSKTLNHNRLNYFVAVAWDCFFPSVGSERCAINFSNYVLYTFLLTFKDQQTSLCFKLVSVHRIVCSQKYEPLTYM